MRKFIGILDDELVFSKRKKSYYRASLLKRFLNLVIDYLTVLNLSIFVGVLLGLVFSGLGKREWLDVLQNDSINIGVGCLMIGIYYISCEHLFEGKTLGKYVTKTSVKNITGQRASFLDILIRTGYRLFPLEPISIFFGKKEGWHDSLSLTMVVED